MSVTVRLNGSNYVSDKTRQAYEKALAEGPIIQATPPAPTPAPTAPEPVPAAPAAAPTPAQEQEPTMPTLADYNRLLDSLDHALAQSHDHQAQTLHVHEQYLSYQADYAKLFTQLLQQQGDIFAHSQASPQQAELAAKVLDTLAQSMARFHDLQSETLNVHKRFLDQQADYTQGHVDILRQQSALSGASVAPAQPRPASPSAFQPRESSPSERHEIHHTHSPRSGHGNGNGNNGNGHHAHPAPIAETAPAIHVPPPAPEKPVAKAAAPAPAAPKPAAQPAASPAPVAAAPKAAPAAAPAFDTAALTSSLLGIVSEKTGYPTDMLELSMDMEADLGIDSIKRVEIMGALQERHPSLPKVEPQALAELRTLGQIVNYVGAAAAPAASTPPPAPARPTPAAPAAAPAQPAALPQAAPAPTADAEALTSSLLGIVSDKTGYPTDMLELSMDMEADLGIDSIKRVEIMGALQERHPSLPKVEPQALAELRTLGQIVNFISAEPAAKKA